MTAITSESSQSITYPDLTGEFTREQWRTRIACDRLGVANEIDLSTPGDGEIENAQVELMFASAGGGRERVCDESNEIESELGDVGSYEVRIEVDVPREIVEPSNVGALSIKDSTITATAGAEDGYIAGSVNKQSVATATRDMRTELRAAIVSRMDAWLAPVELDARAVAYSGTMTSEGKSRASDKGFLHMAAETYIQLVDWVGRQVRGGRGSIPETALPVLDRIGLSPGDFCDLVQRFGKIFKQAAGAPAALAKEATRRKQRWMQCNNSPLKDVVVAPATG